MSDPVTDDDLPPDVRDRLDTERRTNWAGNRTYGARGLLRPRSLDELPDVVTSLPRLHALGGRHSFNDVADTDGVQVALDHLPASVEVDPEAATATVSAWSTYGDLAPAVHEQGFALDNLASLPHITVAGACATATHGSGVTKGNLSTAVRAMTFVDGRGEVVTTRRGDETFAGLVVHLGAIGLVTSLTLDLVPAVDLHQRAYVDLPADTLAAHLDEVMGGADSVSCFTRWQDGVVDTVLHKSTGDPDDDPEDVFGAARATERRHPIAGLDPVHVTEQLGVKGPWYDRIPHFRMGFTPSAGEEIQSEWFVRRSDGPAALDALWSVGDRLDDALQVSEVRTIAADDLWLSPAHGHDVLALHFTWVRDEGLVHAAVDVVEDALSPFDPVPHWGKVSHADGAVYRARYDRLDAFADLVDHHDPDGRLRNDVLDDLLGRTADDGARRRT